MIETGALSWRPVDRPAVPFLLLTLVIAPVALAGCVTELLGPEEATVRTTSCAALRPDEYADLRLTFHEAVRAPVDGWVWLDAFGDVAGREDQAMHFRKVTGPDHDGPWRPEALEGWWSDEDVFDRGRLSLHVLWAPELAGDAVQLWAPGIVAIDASAVGSGAAATDLTESEVGLALLFHGLGHGLGVVNAGIPLHGPDIVGREEPQHHEPEPASVMNIGWHRAETMPGNVTSAYSAGIVTDWQRATQEGGVCVE